MPDSILERKGDCRMFQKFAGLYNTLYTFMDAVITKWLKKDNPTAEANDFITKALSFLSDTFSTFIG